MEKLVPSRARLGGYELNLNTGELRALEAADGGVLLREQPFQILKMLIERGQKIVTREETRKKLWPNDTIVNFDHSIMDEYDPMEWNSLLLGSAAVTY